MEGPLCPGPGCAPRVKPYLLPMGQALAMERDAKEEQSVLVPHKQKEGVPWLRRAWEGCQFADVTT